MAVSLNEGLLSREQRPAPGAAVVEAPPPCLNEGLLSREQRLGFGSSSGGGDSRAPQRRAALARAATSSSCWRTAYGVSPQRRAALARAATDSGMPDGQTWIAASTKGCSRESSDGRRDAARPGRWRGASTKGCSRESSDLTPGGSARPRPGASTKGCSRESSDAVDLDRHGVHEDRLNEGLLSREQRPRTA